MYSNHLQQSMDQSGKVANLARGNLNREKNEKNPSPRSHLRIWSRERVSAVPSGVSLLVLHTLAESGAYTRDSSLFPRRLPLIYIPPPRTMVRVEAAGQIYKQVQSFTYYLRGRRGRNPDMSVEIARWTRACWMRIRRYLRELLDQPKVALSLKTRMVMAEAIESLLYGCST